MYKCFIENINYDCIIKRTSVEFKNKNNKLIIGFFDIKTYNLINNILIINLKCKNIFHITSNNLIKIYNHLRSNIYNLNIEINLPELLVNEKISNDWLCNICLDNTNNNDIVQVRCCKNYLHFDCLLNFIKSNKLFNCPICRNNRCILCLGKGC